MIGHLYIPSPSARFRLKKSILRLVHINISKILALLVSDFSCTEKTPIVSFGMLTSEEIHIPL